MNEIPNFSSLIDKKVLDGDKVRIDDLLNKEIIICNYNVTTSKFKDRGCGYCTKIQFYYADDKEEIKRVFFSGSSVIKDQIEEVAEKLKENNQPLLFKAMVKKLGKYYSLV